LEEDDETKYLVEESNVKALILKYNYKTFEEFSVNEDVINK